MATVVKYNNNSKSSTLTLKNRINACLHILYALGYLSTVYFSDTDSAFKHNSSVDIEKVKVSDRSSVNTLKISLESSRPTRRRAERCRHISTNGAAAVFRLRNLQVTRGVQASFRFPLVSEHLIVQTFLCLHLK